MWNILLNDELFNQLVIYFLLRVRYYAGVKHKCSKLRRPPQRDNKRRKTMNETFGQRFARLRKNRGLTQEELGTKLGLSGQAVSKWENDLSMPDVSLLVQLSELLGVSLDELLGKEQPITRVVPEGERKNINDLVLKVRVDSAEGDKVTVNLPMGLVKVGIAMGMKMPQVKGNVDLENIDLSEVLRLVEAGMVGELVTVESANGDHVRIFVE